MSAPTTTDVHNAGPFSTDSGHLSTAAGRSAARTASSVGVDQLPDRRDLTPELVVDRDLAVDLVARVEHGRVIATAEFGTDPQERDVRLLAHQEHRDLARDDDGLVALL